MKKVGNSLLGRSLAFVDVETNGLNHIRGRIIEVAVLLVENGEVVQTFQTLLNPEVRLPRFITGLTGISDTDLERAPVFADIAAELHGLLNGAVFVAHNVRFDYSFIKQEFARVGYSFMPKQLCTVKLSQALYPGVRGHSLSHLIARHNFQVKERHRAYDDAQVLWQFIQHVIADFPQATIEAAVSKQLRSPALPRGLNHQVVHNLPATSGVYIFKDASNRPLYVGKSVNIKKRVLSHFAQDHAELKEFKIAQMIKHVEVKPTPGELAALLLESKLIKELQPIYNRRLRQTELLLLARQDYNAQGYITLRLEEAAGIDPSTLDTILAVYPRRSRARQSLDELIKAFELCPKLLGLEKGPGACFLRQLHKCRGACIGHELPDTYNRRLSIAFEHQRLAAWPYKGPVLIQEREKTDTDFGLIIDQWCVLGEVSQEPYSEPVIKCYERQFDLDTYKILHSFLVYKSKQITIQALSLDQLATLAI